MILFGASGHAKVIIDILEKSGIELVFLVDANREINTLMSYEVKHESTYKIKPKDEFIIAIGNNNIRKRIVESLVAEFGCAIHPTASLGDDVSVGQGTVVMAGSVINSSSSIGNHVIVNTSACIDHDCKVADFVHIAPNATLCGTVSIGEGTQVGAGSTVIPNLTIGKWVTIGAGTVVTKNIPDYAVVVGNPSKILKYNEREV